MTKLRALWRCWQLYQATLERHVFGKRTEKLPTVATELRKDADSTAARAEAAKEKRR